MLFLTTANTLDTIPAPLRDRMEVLQLSGYTDAEKVQIAQTYLVPKQLAAHGLRPEEISITEDALRSVIRGYTREAASGTWTARSRACAERWRARSPRGAPSRRSSRQTT